jgi:hypothetical protein
MTFDVSTVRVVDKMGLNARQAVFQTAGLSRKTQCSEVL